LGVSAEPPSVAIPQPIRNLSAGVHRNNWSVDSECGLADGIEKNTQDTVIDLILRYFCNL